MPDRTPESINLFINLPVRNEQGGFFYGFVKRTGCSFT